MKLVNEVFVTLRALVHGSGTQLSRRERGKREGRGRGREHGARVPRIRTFETPTETGGKGRVFVSVPFPTNEQLLDEYGATGAVGPEGERMQDNERTKASGGSCQLCACDRCNAFRQKQRATSIHARAPTHSFAAHWYPYGRARELVTVRTLALARLCTGQGATR